MATGKVSSTFNDEDADLIIVTKDNVEFRVHKWLLSRASGFFKDMLSLKQPESSSDNDNLPTIPVPEESKEMEALLRFIYPISAPTFGSLLEISKMMDVAVKYDITVAIESLQHLLAAEQYLKKDPIRLYAIAVRYGFEDLRRCAFKEAVLQPLFTQTSLAEIPELDHISATDLQKIVYSQTMRLTRCREIIENVQPTSGNNLNASLETCESCKHPGCSWWPLVRTELLRMIACRSTDCFLSESTLHRILHSPRVTLACRNEPQELVRAQKGSFFGQLINCFDSLPYEYDMNLKLHRSDIWHKAYYKGVFDTASPKSRQGELVLFEKADLELRTPDGGLFKLNRWLLRAASPVLRKMIVDSESGADIGRKDIYTSINIDKETFAALLHFIYPLERPRIGSSLTELANVIGASSHLEVSFVTKQLQEMLMAEVYLSKDPFRVYAIAANYNFHPQAEIALKRCLLLPLETDTSFFRFSEINNLSASNYAKLLMSHQKVLAKAQKIVLDVALDVALDVPWSVLQKRNPSHCKSCGWYGCSASNSFQTKVLAELQNTLSSSVVAKCADALAEAARCSNEYFVSTQLDATVKLLKKRLHGFLTVFSSNNL